MRVSALVRIGLLALIWGSGFLWIKVSLRGFSPVQLTFGRLALGAAVLLVVVWHAGQRLPGGRTIWLHLFAAAFLGNALPYLLFGIGEQDVASNLAGAINATTPLWTVLFAVFTRMTQTLTPLRIAGLVLGFVGSVLILAPWRGADASLGGALACLAASASYGAGYIYMGRYLVGRNLPPLVLSASQLIAATGLLILGAPFGGFDPVDLRADAVISLAVLGVIGTGFAYVLNYRIITDDGPVLASTITYLLPVVAVLLGLLALDEPLTANMVAGVAIVLAGVALTRTSGRRRRPAAEPEAVTPDDRPGSSR
jgi:drug/metabolite transporter (DMT)-like permease